MGYINTTFLGKEYSIPQDVLTYIDLLNFTNSVQKQLTSAFVRKLRNEIAKDNIGLLGDEDLASEIEQQVGKYIAKLCDNDIFTRTISDYLKNNKGYQLYSEVNKAALEKMKSLLIQEMDAWQAGYEDAVNKAESHVTGMGFSIWSGSFVNHAIYAAMEASTFNKQSKEAESQYQRDMKDLRSRLDSKYGGEKSNYINNTYIPNMEAALTVFAYELLDKYVADLIANGKLDEKTLDYIDIGRSNDLLKNLTLSNNKKAILENAFSACPYNSAVYMQAMKYDLLDYNSFQTAKVFKQDHHILSFFRESWGEVSYPAKFNINYHCINLWALFTDKNSIDLLHELTVQYATSIVNAYDRVVNMLGKIDIATKVMNECSESVILAGSAISKSKAKTYVGEIVSEKVWGELTEKCGHADLFERIKAQVTNAEMTLCKNDVDVFLENNLFVIFEEARVNLSEQIVIRKKVEQQKKEEQDRLQQERKKRNKTIGIVVASITISVTVLLIVLTQLIIPNHKYNTAVKLMNEGKYTEAISLFEELADYKDSVNKINECTMVILECKYNNAIALTNKGYLEEAYLIFNELGDYKDSANRAEFIGLKTTLKSIKVGDHISFGRYEQDNDISNGKEEIEWIVLEVRDGKALVISKYALDCKKYNGNMRVTWETCTLRTWLNDYFITAAFSSVEKALIPTVTVSADKNPYYSTDPGNATQDKVFLLSITEVNTYFNSNETRQCKPTDYTVDGGVVFVSRGTCMWWLRTPGCCVHYITAAAVDFVGSVDDYGYEYDALGGVRPAMWIVIDE